MSSGRATSAPGKDEKANQKPFHVLFYEADAKGGDAKTFAEQLRIILAETSQP